MTILLNLGVLIISLFSVSTSAAASLPDVSNGATDISRQGIINIANVADLTAIDPHQVDSEFVFLKTRGGGLFVWDAADHAEDVSTDRQQGVYIASSDEPSGAYGAWVRQHNGPYFVEWFGAVGDGVTNDSPAIQAALDFVGKKGGVVQLLAATYVASVNLPAGVTLQGSGSSRYANNTKTSATVILRPSAAKYVVSMNKNSSSLVDLDIDGNGVMNMDDVNTILDVMRYQELNIQPEEVMSADINDDGVVDVIDAGLLSRSVTRFGADLTGDGMVDEEDLNEINRMIGLLDELDSDIYDLEKVDFNKNGVIDQADLDAMVAAQDQFKDILQDNKYAPILTAIDEARQ